MKLYFKSLLTAHLNKFLFGQFECNEHKTVTGPLMSETSEGSCARPPVNMTTTSCACHVIHNNTSAQHTPQMCLKNTKHLSIATLKSSINLIVPSILRSNITHTCICLVRSPEVCMNS